MTTEAITPERITQLIAAEAELKRQKEAKSAKARAWYADHKEQLKEQYAANKDRRAAYYEANKERILAQQRRRYYARKATLILDTPAAQNTQQ